MNILINVTEDDIKHGTVRSCWDCPIAKALIRELNIQYPLILSVTPDYIRIRPNICFNGTLFKATLPAKARKFLTTFDNYTFDFVKPFSFILPNVPKELVKYCED